MNKKNKNIESAHFIYDRMKKKNSSGHLIQERERERKTRSNTNISETAASKSNHIIKSYVLPAFSPLSLFVFPFQYWYKKLCGNKNGWGVVFLETDGVSFWMNFVIWCQRILGNYSNKSTKLIINTLLY